MNFNTNNAWMYFDDGGGNKFRNLGGTININATGVHWDSNGLFTTFDGTTLQNLNLNVAAGKDFSLRAHAAGGQVQLNTITVGAGGALTLSSPSLFSVRQIPPECACIAASASGVYTSVKSPATISRYFTYCAASSAVKGATFPRR